MTFNEIVQNYATTLRLPQLPPVREAELRQDPAFLRAVGEAQGQIIASLIQRESHLVEGGFSA